MIFWIDCETTGLDSKKSTAIQYGCIIELFINGKREVVDEFELLCSPFEGCIVDDKALEVNQRTREEISLYKNERLVYNDLKSRLSRYCNPYDRSCKYVVAGYNVAFDIGFLRAMFDRQRDRYFGSWFFWPSLDVAGKVAEYILTNENFNPKNHKLGTMCEHFGISIDAHDAMSDIRATRELYYKLKEELECR